MNPDELNWSAIAPKLQRETKSALISLVYELAAISPEAQRFLQTRYLKKSKTVDKVASYCQVIQEQFAFSDWNNTVTWNFAGVHNAIHNYDKSSQGDPAGLSELWVVALETAIAFANEINLQDEEFDGDLTDLADGCKDHLQTHSQLLPSVSRRLKDVQRKAEALGYYATSESLEDLF
jgi:glycogen debranching enzyme